jgi:hypothetical protein
MVNLKRSEISKVSFSDRLFRQPYLKTKMRWQILDVQVQSQELGAHTYVQHAQVSLFYSLYLCLIIGVGIYSLLISSSCPAGPHRKSSSIFSSV